jgi:hypothetical protein
MILHTWHYTLITLHYGTVIYGSSDSSLLASNMQSRVQRENSRQDTDILAVKPIILELRHGTVSQPNAPLTGRYNMGIAKDYPSLRAACMYVICTYRSVCLHFQPRVLLHILILFVALSGLSTQLSALDLAYHFLSAFNKVLCESLSSIALDYYALHHLGSADNLVASSKSYV